MSLGDFNLYLEYWGRFAVSGDKVYVSREEPELPESTFPLYVYTEPPSEVWAVYGPAIRTFLATDFYGGGHHYIFPFIRPSEIWIESNMYEEDKPYVYLEQFITRGLMREWRLSSSTASTVGTVYASKARVQDLSNSKPLKSFFPRKSSMILSYRPMTLTKDEGNPDIQMAEEALRELDERSQLKEPEWAQVKATLREFIEDLQRHSTL